MGPIRVLLAALVCVAVPAAADTSTPAPAPTAEIKDVIARYRSALEARDAEALIALASPRYHEDAGTPSPADDYDYEGFKQVTRGMMARVRLVRADVSVRNIRITGDHADVEVRYDATFKLDDAGRSFRKTDTRLMKLERARGKWLFLSGM